MVRSVLGPIICRDVVVEGVVEAPPGGGEGAALGEVWGQVGVESGQAGSQDPPVGFCEQDHRLAAPGG